MFSALSAFRAIKYLYAKFLYLFGLATSNPQFGESVWQTVTGPGGALSEQDIKQPVRWPIIMYMGKTGSKGRLLSCSSQVWFSLLLTSSGNYWVLLCQKKPTHLIANPGPRGLGNISWPRFCTSLIRTGRGSCLCRRGRLSGLLLSTCNQGRMGQGQAD